MVRCRLLGMTGAKDGERGASAILVAEVGGGCQSWKAISKRLPGQLSRGLGLGGLHGSSPVS
jgi:hypothetical protein